MKRKRHGSMRTSTYTVSFGSTLPDVAWASPTGVAIIFGAIGELVQRFVDVEVGRVPTTVLGHFHIRDIIQYQNHLTLFINHSNTK